MEWVVSRGPNKVRIAHFDVAGTSETLEDFHMLEQCEDHLGAVYWKEAVEVFVPFLLKKFAKLSVKKVLCLGEGPAASGLALAAGGKFKRVVLTDLPVLCPLMDFNLRLNPYLKEVCRVWPLDWTDDQALTDFKTNHYDAVIGCEVLYGNRFAWPGLRRVLLHTLNSGKSAFFCVTLRNGRKDVDDFCSMLEADGAFLKVNEWELIAKHMVAFRVDKV